MPESRDVRRAPDGDRPASGGDGDAYVYVARRAHGTVALAEARGMTDEAARAIIDRVADELERCAADLEVRRLLVEGAARVVAVAGPDGTPVLNLRLAPGDAALRNALVCLVAPVRATTLPPSTSGKPGLAIEATWGPTKLRRDASSTDGGGAL